MENHRAKRIVEFKAELIAGSHVYPGYIEKISEENIYLLAAPLNGDNDLSPGAALTLKFAPCTGQGINLNCVVTSSFRTPPHGITRSVFMHITDPPPDYISLLQSI